MYLLKLAEIFNQEQLLDFIHQHKKFGMLIGISLPLIEAIFPPLPLSLFVTINVLAFGVIEGYLYSWMGTCLGSTIMFLLVRKMNIKFISLKILKYKNADKIFNWINMKGIIPIFILLAFPFTPSSLVCYISALSNIKPIKYIGALMLGRLVMILSLTLVGYNIIEFLNHPYKSLLMISILIIFSFIIKKYIKI